MKWFYNLKISVKLISAFVLVALLSGMVGIIGITNIKSINSNDTILYKNMTVPITQMSQISTDFEKIRVYSRNMLIANNLVETNAAIDKINFYRDEIDKNAELFNKTIISDRMGDLFQTFVDARKAYRTGLDKVIELAKQEKDAEGMAILSENGEAGKAALAEEEAISKIIDAKDADAAGKSKTNNQLANQSVLLMIVVIIIALVLALGLGLFISNIISKPIRKLSSAADRLAVGDVEINIKSDSTDEVGKLVESFGKMIENIKEQVYVVEKIASGDLTTSINIKSDKDILGIKLTEMIETNNEIFTNLNVASEQVASGAKQVSDSSMALSQGATEQASTIEELTASLEEISSQTKMNANNASEANIIVDEAKGNAVEGNVQMKEMLKAMDEINDSSSNISKIIKVIDEIAFQTNILALNAAVEAARAGQHGKGFAVVAEEVRNLAARSANAAKETTAMIEGSIKKVDGGMKIANKTAGALTQIVEGVERVAKLVNNIAIASNEQATGIAQINQGLIQVSTVVQNNSATSEESAAASEELASQADLLKMQVARFKLKTIGFDKSLKGFEALSPELLKLLGNMSDMKKAPQVNEVNSKETVNKKKITLNEKEYGKY